MLNYIYPFLFLLLLGEDSLYLQPQVAPFGENFLLAKGEKLSIGSGEGELIFELMEVSDSRCPTEAICVWLGNATVKLKVTGQSAQWKEVKMCIGDCRPEPTRSKHTLTTLIDGNKYNITLKEVKPYPGTDKADMVKQIKLVVNPVF